MHNIVEGIWTVVEFLTLRIVPARKREGAEVPESFRLCAAKDGGTFIALNAVDKYGKRYDVEIASPEGFCGGLLFDPETEKAVDFRPPVVGDWVKVANSRVTLAPYEGQPKYKARVYSALQLRVIGSLGRVMETVNSKPPRKRRGV